MSDRNRRRGERSLESQDDLLDRELTSEDPSAQPNPRPRRKKRWWILGTLILLIVLLPNLIGWLGLHHLAIDYGLSKYPVKVEIASLSAGWFQPLKLESVDVQTPEGETLLRANQISTSLPLWQLLSGKLGTITLNGAELILDLREDGSNLEDTLNQIMAAQATDPEAEPGEPQPLPKIQVEIQSGRAILTSKASTGQWDLTEIDGQILTGTQDAPLTFQLKADVTPSRTGPDGTQSTSSPGAMAIAGQVDAGSLLLTGNSAEVIVQMNQLPLSTLGPFLERCIGPTATSGRGNGKLSAYYRGDEQSVSMTFEKLQVANLAMLSPNWIGDDQLSMESITTHGKLQLTPRLILANQFELESDMGKAHADGEFDLQQLMQLAQEGHLSDTSFQMGGDIDLGQLIRMFPETFGLHKDVEVVDGNVSFQVNSYAEEKLKGNSRRIVANLDTANLRARRGGQEFVWAKPIRVVGTLSEQEGQLQIEDLQCISEFLNLSGKGTLESASFKVDGNFQNLLQRLKQFVDIQEFDLAGKFNGEFGWQTPNGLPVTSIESTEPFPFKLGGKLEVQQPGIMAPGIPSWKSDSLTIALSSEGTTARKTSAGPNVKNPIERLLLNLASAGVQIDVGQERAVVTLSEPVSDAMSATSFKANSQITGNLTQWMKHIRHFVDLGPIQMGGDIDVIAALTVDQSAIQFRANEYKISEFLFAGYGTEIAESQVDGGAQGRFEWNDSSITFDDLTVIASSISARGRELKITYPSNLRMDGELAYRANVSRVADWFSLSTSPDDMYWFGNAEGQVQISSDENGIAFTTRSTIREFVAATQSPVQGQPTGPIVQASRPIRQWNSLWREDALQVQGGVKVGNDFDSVSFQNTTVQAEAVKATINGTAKQISTQMILDVQGDWTPDWATIQQVVRHYAGDTIQFEGGGKQTFNLQGPLFAPEATTLASQQQSMVPAELKGTTTFGWQQGALLGLPVGASQLNIRLEDGLAHISTEGIPFAGGKVGFAPTVDLRQAEPVVKMDWTRLVDNVELQPDTARQWLRYVAPLAAEATSATGRFTIDIGEANIPVYQPQTIQARGAVRLKDVVIGAGPAAQQLLASARQIRQLLKPESEEKDLDTWLRMKEQTVPIVVKDGRVYHDQLDFSHKDLMVRTKGSVGFDQTLHLVAEIPIADDWIDGTKYLDSLKGKTLKLPLKGTVSEPRLDTSAIQQLSKDLVKHAAQQAVDKAVTDKLNPKLNEFQQKLNDKFNNKINQFQQDLNEKLGIGGSGESEGGGLLPKPGSLLPDPKELIPKLFQKQE